MSGNRDSSGKKKIVVELTEVGIVLRLVFMGIAIIAASLAFYSVFSAVFRTESGWQTIPVNKSDTAASQEFVFQYQLGVSGRKPAEEYDQLKRAYPKYLDRAYQIFDHLPYEGIQNLTCLNKNPNEAVQIEPELYQALQMLEELNSRYLYYAPVYGQYRSVFGCDTDWEASHFDPATDEQVDKFVQSVIGFASDEQSIRVELMGDNTAMLYVSPEYLQFASENEITCFLDFFYLRNAFALDCVAQQLISDGFTAGTITTLEGFSRVLGEGDYSVKLFDRADGVICQAATMSYAGPMSLISLRDFPLDESDGQYYYCLENGEIRNPFVDPETGRCKSQYPSLLSYSDSMGCGELLVRTLDFYVQGAVGKEELHAKDIETVYFADRTIVASDRSAAFTEIYGDNNVKYQLAG